MKLHYNFLNSVSFDFKEFYNRKGDISSIFVLPEAVLLHN